VSISVLYFDQSGQGTPLSFNLFAAPPAEPSFPIPQLEAATPASPHQLPPVDSNQTTAIVPSSPIEPAAEGF
jgi:hypothetical protein